MSESVCVCVVLHAGTGTDYCYLLGFCGLIIACTDIVVCEEYHYYSFFYSHVVAYSLACTHQDK